MLVDQRLDMICQWALRHQKAKCVLGCIQNSVASRAREGILPLCTALVRPIWNVLYSPGAPNTRKA